MAYIPAPYNGISQSAPQVRLLEQAEDLQDSIVDLPDGFRKRPPLEWLGELISSGGLSSARAHKIKDPDDGSLKILFVNREGSTTVARLFNAADLSSVSLSVDAAAQTYLNGATTPLKSTLRISQAVDYTVLTDRTQVIGTDASLNSTRPYEALFFAKSGAFGKKYQVTITGAFTGSPLVGFCLTPSGDDAADSLWTGTDRIIQAIFNDDYSYSGTNQSDFDGIASGLVTGGFTISIDGGVAGISHPSVDFTVKVQDDQGGVAFIAIKNTVNNFSDLPAKSPINGFAVSVVPTRGDQQGAYFVKYVANAPKGQAPWQETVAPGSQKGFDITHMPVGVFKDSGGNWQLDPLPWKQRTVGDQDTAIDPLFVGDLIQDIGYAFGRILILSGEEVFLSAADDPFRIYPATLTTEIDSDPVSLAPPGNNGQFRSISSFSSNLLEGAYITGLQQQCALRSPGDGPVTPKSVKLSRLAKYELKETFADLKAAFSNNKTYQPVPLGSLYSGIREMKLDRQSGEAMGEDLTAALPKYLPQGINVQATSETSFLTLYGVAGQTKIYVHLYRYTENNERVQNGFFTWNLPSGWTLVDLLCEGTLFYFILLRDGRVCVFTMETNPKTLDDDATSTVLTKLDMRQSESQVMSRSYNAITKQTTIVSRVPLPTGAGYVAARANGSATQTYPEGYLAEVVSSTGSSIVVKGDWTGDQQFYLGLGYVGAWTPSTINQYSQTDSRILHGVLTVNRIWFDLRDASGLSVQVANGNRALRSYNLKQFTFGAPSNYTGEWIVPVKGKNNQVTITIRDEGHIGATISGFEWEGTFVPKTSRKG